MRTITGGGDEDPRDEYAEAYRHLPKLPDMLEPFDLSRPCTTCSSARRHHKGIWYCPWCDRTSHMTCECHRIKS